MYVLDTAVSVIAISGILHQEQEWNETTVLRPIDYGSKVLSDTEIKYGAPKAEIFLVITFLEKYRAYLGGAPFKLRVDNRVLSWLKKYSMNQSYIDPWIIRLGGYHMIIETFIIRYNKTSIKMFSTESPRRRRIEGAARVPFLGILPEKEWEVHHRDHENKSGCGMDRIALMEEIWTVVQCKGTQSRLKTDRNRPLMREILDKLDECEGRMSNSLIDSATDESEAESPIKATQHESNKEVVYLLGTRKKKRCNQ